MDPSVATRTSRAGCCWASRERTVRTSGPNLRPASITTLTRAAERGSVVAPGPGAAVASRAEGGGA